jgi:hypothetical protein
MNWRGTMAAHKRRSVKLHGEWAFAPRHQNETEKFFDV